MLNLKKFESLYNWYKSSGLRVRDFCINECINESKFYYWQKKIKEREGEKSKPAGFVFIIFNNTPIPISNPVTGTNLSRELAGLQLSHWNRLPHHWVYRVSPPMVDLK